jgi:hypothetical protein
MGNATNIQKALDKTLMQFGTDNGIVIALTNVDASTDTSIPYLESQQINTGVESADLGTTDLRNGIYQINIRYASHTQTTPFNEMSDLLNATFKAGACFYHGGLCVSIDSCEPTQLLIDNGWGVLPLNITWSAWTTKL